jgi:protein required for attachment to host cells
MLVHWYVIGNQLELKVFTESSQRGTLKLVKAFKNSLGKEKKSALIRNTAGMGMVSGGRTGRGAHRYMQTQRTDPREEAALQFCREVGEYLNKMGKEKEYSSLTVVAEPKFLGKLRASMSAGTEKKVSTWLKKDLCKLRQSQLPKVLKLKDARVMEGR